MSPGKQKNLAGSAQPTAAAGRAITMNCKTNWLLTSALVAVAFAAQTGGALAAGFALKEQSAEAQGTSYAGAAARADDPTSMFYNAAGITQLPGYQISASAALIMPNATLASGSATTGSWAGAYPYTGVTGTDSGIDAMLPSLSATAQINDKLFAGIAITSPFGLATKYPSNSIARYYALTTSLQTVNIGPTLAYKVTPQISLGGGINIETAAAHMSQAVDFGLIGYAHGLGAYGLTPGSADGIGTLKGSDTALGWNIGALYQPTPDTNIGLSYRSAVYHDLSGSLNYSMPSLVQSLLGGAFALEGLFQNRAATAKLPEPASASLSIAQKVGRWTLLADATYTGWSVFQSLSVYTGTTLATATTEKYRDTVALSAGADYRVNDQFTVRGGIAYDPTPVQNTYRNPQLADNDRYWISIGATYRPTANWALTGSYSHLFANNDTVKLTDLGVGTVNYLKGNMAGVYNVSVDIISAQATYKF
jgi:long-chain fatty acid transport protein